MVQVSFEVVLRGACTFNDTAAEELGAIATVISRINADEPGGD
jgi:hypothetical protein